MAVSDYSTVASSNTKISGINIAEGCAPANMNDAMRQLMADTKVMYDGLDRIQQTSDETRVVSPDGSRYLAISNDGWGVYNINSASVLPLGVDKGGTGATSAAAARSSLQVGGLLTENTWTQQQTFSMPFYTTGYRTRTGTAGPNGGNLFNLYWDGTSLYSYIDDNNTGELMTRDKVSSAIYAYLASIQYGAVGSYGLFNRNASGAVAPNTLVSGSELLPAAASGDRTGPNPAGTWRTMGWLLGSNAPNTTTVCMRVS